MPDPTPRKHFFTLWPSDFTEWPEALQVERVEAFKALANPDLSFGDRARALVGLGELLPWEPGHVGKAAIFGDGTAAVWAVTAASGHVEPRIAKIVSRLETTHEALRACLGVGADGSVVSYGCGSDGLGVDLTPVLALDARLFASPNAS